MAQTDGQGFNFAQAAASVSSVDQCLAQNYNTATATAVAEVNSFGGSTNLASG